jgi:hypothetical protein
MFGQCALPSPNPSVTAVYAMVGVAVGMFGAAGSFSLLVGPDFSGAWNLSV